MVEVLSLSANRIIDNSFKTNIIFLYSYSHIGLVSVYISITQAKLELNEKEFFEMLGIKEDYIVELSNIFIKINSELDKIAEVNEFEVKEALKTVKKFEKYNPDYYKELEKQRRYYINDLVNISRKSMILGRYSKKNRIELR